jgi:glutaminyl-tRNA synthetase
MENFENEIKSDFIREIIKQDLINNKNNGKVITRFPPEPNGYLHIGHAKSICLNFGVSIEFNGKCNLRFDDTNPEKEEVEYVESIKKDVKWLGFDWDDRCFYASDYFEKFYFYAIDLIKSGKAYICSLTAEEIKETRGNLTEPGINSPYRNRSIEENLDLLNRMKNGEFKDGEHVLRAKIDMASPNFNMRDPTIYRIKNVEHHRTGSKWCIYPMYDYAHCISDALEGISHSLCTLEFEDHRPLYDWFLDMLDVPCHPQQIEFARLNLTYTVLSKRMLINLVTKGFVKGWDDPRMPSIAGLRRRGITPEAIKEFCLRIGIGKTESMVDIALLEHILRQDLNKKAPRVMSVLKPLKVVITNYPENTEDELDAINNPEDESMGIRKIPFSKIIFIEQDDFMENPPKEFFRLSPGREVRLRYAYYITCNDVVKDNNGTIIELHCTYDPKTRGGDSPDGRKVKTTLHWVSERHAINGEVRLYDRLFTKEDPTDNNDGKTYLDWINPKSLEVINNCKLENTLKNAKQGDFFQFERLGYFIVDLDSNSDKLIINRTITLKDQWGKIQKKKN